MKTKRGKLSPEEIDQMVISQSEMDEAWENSVKVSRKKNTSISLPAVLASRAAFFASLHREASIGAWLNRVIQERLEIEEAAFAGCKKEIKKTLLS